MIEIRRKITPYNFTALTKKDIRYIVVHYVGAESAAKNNAEYFFKNKLSSSAHYFVDEKEIWQSVEDYNAAWHCGGGAQGVYHPYLNICTNANSIGIEMCCFKDKNGELKIKDATVQNTVWLIKSLMSKYNILPESVLRHYDVTGKLCPREYVNEENWREFKKLVAKKEITELTSANDIIWELADRGIVTDKEGMLEEIGKNPGGRLYWLARKAVQYIREQD